MTTNTTKLAEAIGLLSTVLSSEIAQINHPFDDDDEEIVALDDYNELKEIADAFNDEVSNALDGIRGEISNCLEWESDDPLTQAFDEKMWDDEEETTTDDEEAVGTSSPTDEAEIIEKAESRIAELEASNEKLKSVLESVAESVNDLYVQNETFEEELGAY
jgi:hypothetical protein